VLWQEERSSVAQHQPAGRRSASPLFGVTDSGKRAATSMAINGTSNSIAPAAEGNRSGYADTIVLEGGGCTA
jgi:hypothetical protein